MNMPVRYDESDQAAEWRTSGRSRGGVRRTMPDIDNRTPMRTRGMLRIAVLVGLLAPFSACVGQFATKAMLTEQCGTDWKQGVLRNAVRSASASSANSWSVLVFNIHDRLQTSRDTLTGGSAEARVVCIGDLAAGFDLVLAQEAFIRPKPLARYTGHRWSNSPVFSKGGGADWWPLREVCEICMSPGLLMLAPEKPAFVYAEPYGAVAGWNTRDNKADRFFSKGLQLVKFRNLWVLNSHMDSGRGKASIDARRKQFAQLTAALERLVPRDAPLLVGMDSNLRPEDREQDGEILHEFLRANRLTLAQKHRPDLIAVRAVDVSTTAMLPLKGVLSDHDALTARLVLP